MNRRSFLTALVVPFVAPLVPRSNDLVCGVVRRSEITVPMNFLPRTAMSKLVECGYVPQKELEFGVWGRIEADTQKIDTKIRDMITMLEKH